MKTVVQPFARYTVIEPPPMRMSSVVRWGRSLRLRHPRAGELIVPDGLLRRSHIASGAQLRVDEVPVTIDGPIQVAPAAVDLEVGFVDVPALARAASCAMTPLAQRLIHHGQQL